MSKTWKAPLSVNQRIEKFHVRPGAKVDAGQKLVDMRVPDLPADFPCIAVEAPVSGYFVLWPGIHEGMNLTGGTKVFSIFSEVEWELLAEIAGESRRADILLLPDSSVTGDEFSNYVDAVNKTIVERMFGLGR